MGFAEQHNMVKQQQYRCVVLKQHSTTTYLLVFRGEVVKHLLYVWYSSQPQDVPYPQIPQYCLSDLPVLFITQFFWKIIYDLFCLKTLFSSQTRSQVFQPIFDLSIKLAYWSCLRLLSYDQDAKKKPRSQNLKYNN